jgi:4-carboxymuconolactone decarboxylase
MEEKFMKLLKLAAMLKMSALFCAGLFVAGGSAGAAPAGCDLTKVQQPSETMLHRVEKAEANYQKSFGREELAIARTDPGFAHTMKRFTYGEVAEQGNLSAKERALLTIAILETQGDKDLLTMNVQGALKVGVTPVEIKEAVYQTAPYIGFPKALAALKVTNEIFKQKGIKLPLEDQATVTEADRLEKGLAVQKAIFGPGIDTMYVKAPDGQLHIQHYLSGYCFGDTYTRKGLDLKMREMLTMVAIAALGGCEPQLKAHIAGNLSVGNSPETIVAAVTQCVPYIGFPRSLNALRCVNEVLAAQSKK